MKPTTKDMTRYKAIHVVIMQSDVAPLQEAIDTGMAWKLEGSYGRAAMQALEDGACVLPDTAHRDYYGNQVPPFWALQPGTKGTIENAERYYDWYEGGK
jgi:hypothetical protein